ncbi:MAG: hypothetical protein DME08_10640 [Candidatus Rokuibacteriota bacterium]|nr:MAG: hypothetical protein DME08_10640 [Candidatus Rokubacteria bacterium]
MSTSALGASEGALEHVTASFRTRIGTYTGAKVSEFQAVQIKIARARPHRLGALPDARVGDRLRSRDQASRTRSP